MTKYQIFLSKAATRMLSKLRKADMVLRNKGRALVWLLKTAITPLAARTRASDVKVILQFAAFCSRLARKSGIKYLVLYLKASQVLLQQSIGGQKLPDTRPLKVAVSRSRSGLPRLIPREHRLLIKKMSRRTIRLWMTLLGLYRVLDFKGVVSTTTIEKPGKVIPGDAIVGFQRFIHDHFYQMASGVWGFTPLLRQATSRNRKGKFDLWTDFARRLKATMFEIAKSSPTAGAKWHDATVSTARTSLVAAATKWSIPEHSSLRSFFNEWCKHTDNLWLSQLIDKNSKASDWLSGSYHLPETTLGRLALKEEAAGKIRVFAMVDAYTQWALYPLHREIMSTLSTWAQDGTYDQLRPVKALLKMRPSGLWSFDLSAATDRLPLQFQKIVLQPVLGLHAAESWGNILVKRSYSTPDSRSVFYAVGQPMGAYSSWAMLALTHHALVQWAWYRVCVKHQKPYTWFRLYAVLGDDVIIGHAEVAAEYLEVMATLGVEVGLAKSLVSPNKLVGEFAKRFFIPRDASMIPFKEVIAARYNIQEFLQFVRKYSLSVNNTLSFMNFGYKVKGSLNKEFSKLGSRLRNQLLMLSNPTSVLGVGLKTYLTLIGWGRLGPALSTQTIAQVVEDFGLKLLDKVKVRSSKESKDVWLMMMVKRDHGQRYNPFDYLYDRYEMVIKKLDGYTYELSEIEKALKSIVGVRHDLSALTELMDLERRLEGLPKPTSFDERPPLKRRSDSLKWVSLWRKAQAAKPTKKKTIRLVGDGWVIPRFKRAE